jgi:RNA recognition motif-containing protein
VTKLYIGNLPFSATDDMLRHIFGHVGAVRSAKIITDGATGRSKGFGFVVMASAAEAADAISRFNGDSYEGRIITVSEARQQESRPPSLRFSGSELEAA